MNRFVHFTIAVLSFLPAHARAQEVTSIPNLAQFEAEQACLKKAEKVLERGWQVLREHAGPDRWQHIQTERYTQQDRYRLRLIANQQAENIRKRAEDVLKNCLEAIGTT
jgi:hypothetical protein